MAPAYLVKYNGPRGACPDAVVTLALWSDECAGDQAAKIKQAIVSARGGEWNDRDVTIREIRYLGPWFHEAGDTTKRE